MFQFLKKHRQTQEQKPSKTTEQRKLVFRERCVIDVTNFDVSTPGEPLGYLSGGMIHVFSDGDVVVSSEDEKSVLDTIHLTDVFTGSDNINNFDPEFETTAALITREKGIRFSFQSIELKRAFWDSIVSVYSDLETG